jgi:putative nucleotidyltransferase with HDIG domain
MSPRAIVFVGFVIAVGWINLAATMPSWRVDDVIGFAVYFFLTVLAAGWKLRLPSVNGTISVGFFFVLIGIVSLSLPQVLVTGCVAVAAQCLWHPKTRLRPIQLLFNVANTSIAITSSYRLFNSSLLRSLPLEWPVVLAVLACSYFLCSTLPVAAAIALTEAKSIRQVWYQSYLWVFPYYLAGAATAGLVEIARHYLGWQSSMLVMPAMYLVYRSYRLYLGRIESEALHAQETAALHLRTIESLALAIEAKDHTTHEHLQRVQIYAIEIGKELRLSETELQALRTASILHDIGKIAVPEQILCKPGKLTPEEFQKIKIHPVVGAEILARVQFPYPVVPIVRSHHEKWDGSGYPDGLKGEDIPIGARILSVVDCLDALASDRQYRRALPLDKAMEMVAEQAHKAFDPKVVGILQNRYTELERLARGSAAEALSLSTDIEIIRGAAPDAGFEKAKDSVAAADTQGRADALLARLQSVERRGRELSPAEVLALTAGYVREVVPYDCIVFYSRSNALLILQFASGIHSNRLSSVTIPMGQGMSGWVAANAKPILNGNPSVDCADLDSDVFQPKLKSALAIPLGSDQDVTGVLALLREGADAFSQTELQQLFTTRFALGRIAEGASRTQPDLADALTLAKAV